MICRLDLLLLVTCLGLDLLMKVVLDTRVLYAYPAEMRMEAWLNKQDLPMKSVVSYNIVFFKFETLVWLMCVCVREL